MAPISADAANKISTDAATQFVDSFYPALNSKRDQLTSFYLLPIIIEDIALPIIVWNGNNVPNPEALQQIYEEQMPKSRYDVQNYDCHILNPNYAADSTTSGNAMSILVTVSGNVKYGESGATTLRGFSDNLVLVPNPAARDARGRNERRWLIQSQTFRLVV